MVRLAAVGFDLDGTLFDHRGSAATAAEQFVRGLGREATPELVATWFDLEAEHFEAWRAGRVSFAEQRRLRLRAFLDALGVEAPGDADAVDLLFDSYLTEYRQTWRAFDDAVPLLRRLRARGVRVGVLTNGNRAQQLDKLRVTGLAPLVDVVCVSEEIGCAKPDRRAFEILAERLGAEADRLGFVGDNAEQDATGARAAGIRAGLVDRDVDPPVGLEAALRSARL